MAARFERLLEAAIAVDEHPLPLLHRDAHYLLTFREVWSAARRAIRPERGAHEALQTARTLVTASLAASGFEPVRFADA